MIDDNQWGCSFLAINKDKGDDAYNVDLERFPVAVKATLRYNIFWMIVQSPFYRTVPFV